MGREIPGRDARLKRLAERIDGLKARDENAIRYARHISAMRHEAAVRMHGLLNDFVHGVNKLLTGGEVTLDPARFLHESFQETTPCLFQINVRGRILQVQFTATPELISSEDFRIPYTLSGSVRAFNQELLDKDLIQEQLIFYTVEKQIHGWRFFDSRTYRSGQFDLDYLISLLEQLV